MEMGSRTIEVEDAGSHYMLTVVAHIPRRVVVSASHLVALKEAQGKLMAESQGNPWELQQSQRQVEEAEYALGQACYQTDCRSDDAIRVAYVLWNRAQKGEGG